MLCGCLKFTSWGKAGAAALALCLIQVGIGVLYKAAQKDGGGYAFSQSAAVTISEFLKLAIATALFYREWKRRRRAGRILPVSRLHKDADNDQSEEMEVYISSSSENGSRDSTDTVALLEKEDWSAGKGGVAAYQDETFLEACVNEVPPQTRVGFINLAFFYAMINNLVFVLFVLADPGTIQLMKSGVTLITAVVFLVFLNRPVTKGQWIAVTLQVAGLVVSQYKANSSTYPFGTYFLLASQTFLSAVSGVYNEVLNKSGNSSLHGDNMVLYLGGTVINMLLHIMMRLTRDDEPWFFQGFSEVRPCMIVISNVFVGLAVTAVYKYADALVKCFATAISTGVLLYLSPLLFGAEFGFLTLPGTFIVFMATYMYIEEGRPADPNRPPNAFQRLYGRWRGVGTNALTPAYSWLGPAMKLAFNATATLIIIASFQNFGDKIKLEKQAVQKHDKETHLLTAQTSNFLAYIRWNSNHPERIPILAEYEPFFHTTHYSIPGYVEHTNITHDGYISTFQPYVAVAETMSQILNSSLPEHKNITGLFYFHFDAWIDPLGFNGMDPEKVWYGVSSDPSFRCFKNPGTEYPGWAGWARHDTHDIAPSAVKKVKEMGEYVTDGEEFCAGWSDIYYIPRWLWADYIYLSLVFAEFKLFHEVAIPTMLMMIDRTRRRNPLETEVLFFGDCWGNCCSPNPPMLEVAQRRCGHKLTLQDPAMVELHFSKIRKFAALLGTETTEHGHWNLTQWIGDGEVHPPNLKEWTEGNVPQREWVDYKDVFGAP